MRQPGHAATAAASQGETRDASRGQILVIFAGALMVLLMMAALVVDVSWYWVNSLRVQRAADAAALAGAVMLPDRASDAYTLAANEAAKNGYVAGADTTITSLQDKGNPRRLDVTIDAQVGTFFMRVVGISSIAIERTSEAEFTLPVPMGSPQSYYGVGFFEGSTADPKVNKPLTVDDPVSGKPLASQGFWGAIFTSGGLRENGDRYAPAYLGNGVTGQAKGSANPDHDPNGYDYTIEVGDNGEVKLFDPIFCGTGDNGHGGSFGAGDHWTDHSPSQVIAPVAITYRLYDTNGTIANTNDDGNPIVPPLVYDPAGKTLGDFSGDFGTPSNANDANRQDCAKDPAHDQWVPLATGLPAGAYRLNVNTSLQTENDKVGAENLFSIWVGSAGGTARVYGSGRMAAYTNLDAGNQTFYFAQIEKVHAGKTLEIQLFDPGESSGDAFLRFLDPDGDSYDYATFDWVADDGRSGKGVTSPDVDRRQGPVQQPPRDHQHRPTQGLWRQGPEPAG